MGFPSHPNLFESLRIRTGCSLRDLALSRIHIAGAVKNIFRAKPRVPHFKWIHIIHAGKAARQPIIFQLTVREVGLHMYAPGDIVDTAVSLIAIAKNRIGPAFEIVAGARLPVFHFSDTGGVSSGIVVHLFVRHEIRREYGIVSSEHGGVHVSQQHTHICLLGAVVTLQGRGSVTQTEIIHKHILVTGVEWAQGSAAIVYGRHGSLDRLRVVEDQGFALAVDRPG